MNFSDEDKKQKAINGIMDCINSELQILQNVSAGFNCMEQKFVIQETKKSIKATQEILKLINMPQIAMHRTFKSKGRTFYCCGMGWDGKDDTLQFYEIKDGVKVGELKEQKKKFMAGLVKNGDIEF